MSWLYNNDVVQRLGENAFLYDLSKIRGVAAILSRIPDNMSGVYAWYRNSGGTTEKVRRQTV